MWQSSLILLFFRSFAALTGLSVIAGLVKYKYVRMFFCAINKLEKDLVIMFLVSRHKRDIVAGLRLDFLDEECLEAERMYSRSNLV